MMKKIKKIINKKNILKFVVVLGIIFTFVILDLGVRYLLWKDIGFVSYRSFSPLFFSVSYILVILILITIFDKHNKLLYIIIAVIFNIYFLTQMIHFKILGSFFSIVSLFSTGEATDYLGYALGCINNRMLIVILLSILSMIVTLILWKKIERKENSKKDKICKIVIIILLIAVCRTTSLYKLGSAVSAQAWDSWKIPRNVYDNYSNNNRSFMVSGMYEYIFRDIYLYTKQKFSPNVKEDIKDINNYMEESYLQQEVNDYTGIFKDKNVIVIMMESIDDFLNNEEIMPTLSYLSLSGLNFENRYSPFFGGAMTINSEFASISGLYSISSEKAIYNYSNNNFDYSLPSMFKKNGYAVNSIHMNNGEFYNRKNFHLALGFENHYSLSDLGYDADFSYDTNIVLNDDSFNLIINDNKFLTYITTYSAHVPYIDNYMCANLRVKNPNLVIDGNEELSCLRLLARETDDFLKYLIERLNDVNLLDDTVLVVFSDHYSYGYNNIEKIKGISDSNLLQHTPLVIWNSTLEHKDIKTMVDTADITPTLFNMFGLDYNPKLYMGTDIFSSYHENFVYFSDYSWYDGVNYSKNIEDSEYVRQISQIVNRKIDINSKIISSDYYKTFK